MKRVYIVQDNPYSAKNFAAAERWGSLKVCIAGHVSYPSLDQYCSQLDNELAGITEVDWLILTGHPVLMGYASTIMTERTGYLNVLVWDQQRQEYLPYSRKVYND